MIWKLYRKGAVNIFKANEIDTINNYKNGIFAELKSINYDGSYNIDVFDLYRCDKESTFLVIEEGQSRLEDSLEKCLDYIHKWL